MSHIIFKWVYFKFPCPYSGCKYLIRFFFFPCSSLSFMHSSNFHLSHILLSSTTYSPFVFHCFEKLNHESVKQLSISNSTCQHQLPLNDSLLLQLRHPLPCTGKFLLIISWLSHLKSVSPPDQRFVYPTLKKRQNKNSHWCCTTFSKPPIVVHIDSYLWWFTLSVLWFWILSSVNLNL